MTESEINGILKESIGYPLGVAITARQMSDGKPFSPELTAHTYREVFAYFEAAVYNRFDLPVRRLLLELSLFEDFDMEMVRMVSGDPRAGERMDWLLRHTTMLRYDSRERFHFWAGFRAFLLWEMDREYTEEKRKALFSRGGLYYELKEDYAHALECYTQGGDHTRVAELLVRNADLHPGMGHYLLAQYFRRGQPDFVRWGNADRHQLYECYARQHAEPLLAVCRYRQADGGGHQCAGHCNCTRRRNEADHRRGWHDL